MSIQSSVKEWKEIMSGTKTIDLKKILSVDQLPAMPHSALTILQFNNETSQVNIGDLARPIEADPGLTAQVLKFLNSSYFGFQNKVSSVKQGITLVGVRVVKNFALWNAVFSLIPNPRGSTFSVKNLWQDSLRRAMFARLICLKLGGGDPEEAFAAALLQDMAIPLLLKELSEDYVDLLNQLAENKGNVRLSSLEKEHFGWDHADAAGVMGSEWGLPEKLRLLLAQHLEIEKYIDNPREHSEQVAVALSAFLPTTTLEGWAERERFEHYLEKILPGEMKKLDDMFAQVDEEYAQFAAILQLTQPKVSLVEINQAAMQEE
jgi:HD-like signal output (HDOD) protein